MSQRRLATDSQKWLQVDMKPIIDRDGNADVWNIERNGDEQWLNTYYEGPDDG